MESQKFSCEFKLDAVARVEDRGYPVFEVAERFGGHENRDDGDAVVLADEGMLAKLAASGNKVQKIEWSGSMADPNGEPASIRIPFL